MLHHDVLDRYQSALEDEYSLMDWPQNEFLTFLVIGKGVMHKHYYMSAWLLYGLLSPFPPCHISRLMPRPFQQNEIVHHQFHHNEYQSACCTYEQYQKQYASTLHHIHG